MTFRPDSYVDLRALPRGLWRVLDPIVYDGAQESFTVPPGFVTDLASVPRVFTVFVPRYGSYTRAAVLHDLLCVEAHAGRFARRDADGIFRRVLREEGVGWVLRWTLWAAVRAGGRMSGADAREWLVVSGVGLGYAAAVVGAAAAAVAGIRRA